MSQIDKIIYIPILIWFIFLFIFFYFLIFSYFLSIFLTIMKVRTLYYETLILYNVYMKNITSNIFLCFSSPKKYKPFLFIKKLISK